MASCITSKWGNDYSPQVRLTVSVQSDTATTAVLRWQLDYVAHGFAASVSASRAWSVKIGGSTVKSGNFSIRGITGTEEIDHGTKTINKTTSKQSISFSCSMAFKLTWSGSYASSKSASGSISVAAKKSYKVAYNANGGSGAPSAQTKWHGTTLTLSSTKPTRTGYTFLGWSTSASATSATWAAGGSYTTNAADTLYAVWKANTFTVSFDANGGSGAPGNQTKTYGVGLVLSSVIPVRTNYNFLGWGTSLASTTVSYAPGATYTTNSAATLYAIWELAYIKPRITNLAVDRCDSTGAISDEGTYGRVKFDWATDREVSSILIEWKMFTEEAYTGQITVPATGTSGSVEAVLNGDFGVDMFYTIQVTVTDEVDSSTTRSTLEAMEYVMDFLAGGKGVAIGGPASIQGLFDVMFKSAFRDVVSLDDPTGEGATIDDVYKMLSSINNNLSTINANLAYKNIAPYITIDSTYVASINAYVENGNVHILLVIKSGWTSSHQLGQINDLTYAPRSYSLGTIDGGSSSADKTKGSSIRVSSNGRIAMWLTSALSYNEFVCFSYPARTN